MIAQCVAHKEKQRLNVNVVIIHEFQLREMLTRADFYRDAPIIKPSIKPSITCLYRHRFGLYYTQSDMRGRRRFNWRITALLATR